MLTKEQRPMGAARVRTSEAVTTCLVCGEKLYGEVGLKREEFIVEHTRRHANADDDFATSFGYSAVQRYRLVTDPPFVKGGNGRRQLIK